MRISRPNRRDQGKLQFAPEAFPACRRNNEGHHAAAAWSRRRDAKRLSDLFPRRAVARRRRRCSRRYSRHTGWWPLPRARSAHGSSAPRASFYTYSARTAALNVWPLTVDLVWDFGATMRSENQPVVVRAACRPRRGLEQRRPPDGWLILPQARHEGACRD
jgi:hypothetical protein